MVPGMSRPDRKDNPGPHPTANSDLPHPAAPSQLPLRLPSQRRANACQRRLLTAACALASATLLYGCGPRPPWQVQWLAESPLPRQPEDAIRQCEARLGLAPERAAPADATNFGERQGFDVYGRAVPNRPQLIVLHETVIGAADTLRKFATPHPKDDDQASYHMLVDIGGQRLRIVNDDQRAYGAGMAAWGDMTVRIRPTSVGSINNLSLHLGLETPADGRGDTASHSGYSDAQYRSAAAQVLLWQARYGIPLSRVTTHAAVDRSRSRYDPRSFRWERFDAAWQKAAKACGFEVYDTGRATL